MTTYVRMWDRKRTSRLQADMSAIFQRFGVYSRPWRHAKPRSGPRKRKHG